MRSKTRNLILAALFAALTALGAFLRVPLGLMSVTLQFLFTLLAGLLLGPRWGAVSQAAYVALGLVGLPVFTLGGGPGYIFQPSFGFLLGLVPAAWVAGHLGRGKSRFLPVFFSCLAALAVLYAIGLPYMALILNVYLRKNLSLSQILWSGMVVYLPGDALKLLLCTLSAPALCRALAKTSGGADAP